VKVALIDCIGGVSGNMLLGAILDAGVDVGRLESELRRMELPHWWIESRKVVRKGIAATHVDIKYEAEDVARNLDDIVKIIDGSGLENSIRAQARTIFERLAAAEAKVHGISTDQVHFHEVGAVDAIIDIVGAVVGFWLLGVREIHATELPIGRGYIQCAHGTLPNPAPATAELLRGVPTRATELEGELVTPTGAAIVTTLARSFDFRERISVDRIGYGAGSRDLSVPNVTRLMVAELLREDILAPENVVQMETNIDDLNPQVYEFLMSRLFEAGALDVFMTPVYMKKNRPGTMLTVLSPCGRESQIVDIILRETTSLGVRMQTVQRATLPRHVHTIETSFGPVRVKVVGRGREDSRPQPEYDDCRRIAGERGLPLLVVIDRVRQEAREHLGTADAVK